MSSKKLLLILTASVVSFSIPALAQQETPGRNEFSVQALGSFVTSTKSNGVDQSATNSGGVLASYRFFFNRHNGVEANYGYSLNTQNYGFGGPVNGVSSYSHEFSAAYVFRFPLRRLTPFVLAGAGGLVFDPKNNVLASTQTQAAFLYGAGADFNLSRHWFVRAEYRGFVYNSPTFGLDSLAGTSRLTHRAEPSIGFGFRL